MQVFHMREISTTIGVVAILYLLDNAVTMPGLNVLLNCVYCQTVTFM